METLTPLPEDPNRYRAKPTVMEALRSPKILSREVLAGLVVALALIPEAIAFSVIAGVDPKVGLFASFIMAVVTAIVGGRPAMISAATGAVALVIAPVSRQYGFDYFIATVILAGIFQVTLALLGAPKLMRFIPRSVMVGFVNALAILVFMSQLPHLFNVPSAVYWLVAAGLVLLIVIPRFLPSVWAPLITIVLMTIAVVSFGITVPTVGDQGELPSSLPGFFLPNVPLTLETFTTIAPYSLAMAVVGLLESLLTAKLVDEITDTHSRKVRESMGQGIANMVSGFFGAMGGCAVIGQTMINVKISGARTRISTFLSGIFLLILVVTLGDTVGRVPMAALVAVMMIVVYQTFDWRSIAPKTLKRMPKSETAVMLITVVFVVISGNLAVGVGAGIIAAAILFVRKVAHFAEVERHIDVDPDTGRDRARYTVTGELFFASSNDLTTQFGYSEDPDLVVIDMTKTRVWDASTVTALDAIVTKYAELGTEVHFRGMDDVTRQLYGRLSEDTHSSR